MTDSQISGFWRERLSKILRFVFGEFSCKSDFGEPFTCKSPDFGESSLILESLGMQCVAVFGSVLQCVAVCCSVLQYLGMQISGFCRVFTVQPHVLNAQHCNTLQHTATHCNTLQHAATHCITLHLTAPHCNTLQHTATQCITLQHTATHCNTLQRTTRHCNTLQHTATGWNTLQHAAIHYTVSLSNPTT